MSPSRTTSVPDIFHAGSRPRVEQPPPARGGRARRRPRLGGRSILLSVANAHGGGLLLSFSRTRGGIAFWRSLSPERSGLERVETFPGPFGPHAVARLLASGAAGPAVDAGLVADTWVDGVDDLAADLLRLAWCRHDGRLDPRAAAVLALPWRALDEACERTGQDGVDGLLELGEEILECNAAWLERHRGAIDAEVDRRAAGEAAGERRRRELRGFVESCLLTLGRMPRASETADRWDGASVAGRHLGSRERRRLRLDRGWRVGRYHVRARYLDAVGSIGWGDFESGPGWFWDVANPDPGWVMTCTMGPYDTPEDARADARQLAEDG